MTNKQRGIDRLLSVLPDLTDGQLDWLEQVASLVSRIRLNVGRVLTWSTKVCYKTSVMHWSSFFHLLQLN